MEEALDADRLALARLGQESERLAALEEGHRQALEGAGEALDSALAEGRDDLARPLIRRRLETERRRAALGRRREALAARRDPLARRLAEREARLADLRGRAALLGEGAEGEADPIDAPALGPDQPIRDEDVEIALLQAKRRRGVPA
jgi:hypothetical protein